MSTKIALGAQWGDEGKAKVVDYLTLDSDIVVRYQGGANAGHTVKVGDMEFVFHMIPSGIMHLDKVCVIGNGVVVDPQALLEEIDDLLTKGFSCDGRLMISQSAHLVLPYHKVLDRAGEESKGGVTIGTTGRGIGPAYRDKVERTHGIRVMDLFDEKQLENKLRNAVEAKNQIIEKIYNLEPLEFNPIIDAYSSYADRLRPFVCDISVFLNDAIDSGKNVLFEGAQGTLLDVDHGTYPYVTSSNTTAGAACTGSGVGPTRIKEVIGVTKAYTTRVGNGPFPTEMLGDEGDHLRRLGNEFGATTGRARRCGWFDVPILRSAKRLNGLTSIALTRLDTLDTMERLKVCVAYDCRGERLEQFPADLEVVAECQPIYEEIEGWKSSTAHIRAYEDLPSLARAYVDMLVERIGLPASLISVGPERDATIVMD
ncbi:MAG: adenylosuccinate synthase [Candidatus Latescibacterota bacterium]|nr:adenylosuccinate synthase [Candidatus Latescibacterota bacterium]